MKKIIAILLVCTMIFTLCACGEKDKKEETKKTETTVKKDVETVEFLTDGIEVGEDPTPIDIAALYDTVTYVPQMFYGKHEADNYWSVGTIEEGIDFVHPEKGKMIIDYLPKGIAAGPTSVYEDISFCDDYHIAKLKYASSTYGTDIFTAYEVQGKKIIFTVIESYTFDPVTLKVDVKLTDTKFEYDFSFDGNTITLSDGKHSVVLGDESRLGKINTINGYIADNSPDMPSDDMRSISCNTLTFVGASAVAIGNKKEEANKLPVRRQEYEGASAVYTTDGLFKLARKDAKTGKVVTTEYLMFVCGWDGFVLCDGEKTYCYTKGYKQIAIEELSANLEPEHIALLKQMSELELGDIVEKRNRLFAELETELGKQGVKAAVNRRNGEIALDSTVLFATGESTLSDEGKAFLKKFVTAYSSVVLKEEYNSFLSKVMIEGHTDSTGTVEGNKALSKARADAVLEYCTSAESGLTAAQIGTIKNLLGTFGYAAERPVLKADGTEDADASRRVGFRFIINIDTSKIETTTEA